MPDSKYGKWDEINHADALPYLLPDGVTRLCEIIYDDGDTSRSSYDSFIGTNKGVFRYRHYEDIDFPREKDSAKQVGLEEFEIEKLEQRGETIIAFSKCGKVFEAKSYILKGTR